MALRALSAEPKRQPSVRVVLTVRLTFWLLFDLCITLRPFRGIAQLYRPGTMSSPLLMAFVARQLHLRGLVSGMLQVACRALDSRT